MFTDIATPVTIGTLAKKTGCNVETIRYYERIGMMPKSARSASGYRLYDHSHMRRLNFIRRCRVLGFSQQQTRTLQSMFEDPHNHTRSDVKAFALSHLEEIKTKIKDLRKLEKSLRRLTDQCDGGEVSAGECPILTSLNER